MERVAIIGAGGHGREVGDVFEALNAVERRYEVLGYVVDAECGRPGTLVGERPILGDLTWLGERARDVVSVVAVASPSCAGGWCSARGHSACASCPSSTRAWSRPHG
jgi:hypothetical protein